MAAIVPSYLSISLFISIYVLFSPQNKPCEVDTTLSLLQVKN